MPEISLAKARVMIRKSLQKARDLDLKPMSVAVVDAGGHLKAFEREDGAAPGRFAIAHAKAYGVIMMGLGGTAQMARAEQQAYFMDAVNGVFGGKRGSVSGNDRKSGKYRRK